MLECFNQHGAQETPMARKNYDRQKRMHAHTCTHTHTYVHTHTRTHARTPTHPRIGN